jgi:hypothetical protein
MINTMIYLLFSWWCSIVMLNDQMGDESNGSSDSNHKNLWIMDYPRETGYFLDEFCCDRRDVTGMMVSFCRIMSGQTFRINVLYNWIYPGQRIKPMDRNSYHLGWLESHPFIVSPWGCFMVNGRVYHSIIHYPHNFVDENGWWMMKSNHIYISIYLYQLMFHPFFDEIPVFGGFKMAMSWCNDGHRHIAPVQVLLWRCETIAPSRRQM